MYHFNFLFIVYPKRKIQPKNRRLNELNYGSLRRAIYKVIFLSYYYLSSPKVGITPQIFTIQMPVVAARANGPKN